MAGKYLESVKCKYGFTSIRVPSIGDAYLQEVGSTSGHTLPRGGEGLVVRIKFRGITQHPHGLIYE